MSLPLHPALLLFETDGGGVITPLILLPLFAALILWVFRYRRLTRLRETMAQIYSLSEQIHAAGSATQIQQRLARSLPNILHVRGARLWQEAQSGNGLEPAVGTSAQAPPGAVACFRMGQAVEETSPRRRIFIPMQVAGRTTGVLEMLPSRRWLGASTEEKAGLRHLANQAAIALQVIDQGALREQVIRSERMGAVGQLISGVAAELNQPMLRLADGLQTLRSEPTTLTRDNLDQLLRDASQVSATISRLISFGRSGVGPPMPIDLNKMVKDLCDFRAQTWRLQGMDLRLNLHTDALTVVAAAGQLEQAILSVMIHAEQTIVKQPRRVLTITTKRESSAAIIDLSFPGLAPAAQPDRERDSLPGGLAFAAEILRSQSGAFQAFALSGESHYQMVLPVSTQTGAPRRIAELPAIAGAMTFLVLEPDSTSRRMCLEALAAFDQRGVFVPSADDALVLAGRMRFDGILSSITPPDCSWEELFERIRRLVPAFVLLHDGVPPAVPPHIDPAALLHLRRPVQATALGEVLSAIESRHISEFQAD